MDGKSTIQDELTKLCTDFIKLTDFLLDNDIVSKLEYDQLIKNKAIFIQEQENLVTTQPRRTITFL